jgi:hypothetical protein
MRSLLKSRKSGTKRKKNKLRKHLNLKKAMLRRSLIRFKSRKEYLKEN